MSDDRGVVFQDKDRGPSIRVASGDYFNLVAPDPYTVRIEDIASAGDNVRRFTGHGRHNAPLSLVTHQTLVCHILRYRLDTLHPEIDGEDRERLLLTALLHDGHEVYVGDLSRPMKVAMRMVQKHMTGDFPGREPESPYDHIERLAMRAVAAAFPKIIYPHPHLVIEADLAALHIEADFLWGAGTGEDWGLPPIGDMPYFLDGIFGHKNSPRDQFLALYEMLS